MLVSPNRAQTYNNEISHGKVVAQLESQALRVACAPLRLLADGWTLCLGFTRCRCERTPAPSLCLWRCQTSSMFTLSFASRRLSRAFLLYSLNVRLFFLSSR